MKEIIADSEKLAHAAQEWISAPVEAIGAVCHRAGQELTSTLDQGKDLYESAQRQTEKRIKDINVIIHHYPYPVAVMAIGAGVVIGFLVARRFYQCR